jgi:hypothetical protein
LAARPDVDYNNSVRALFASIVGTVFLPVSLLAAERINHAGRILGPMPVVTNAVLFNTPEADAIVSALQIFPRDNAWSEDISRRPLLPNSAMMIAQIFTELNNVGTNSPKLRAFQEMNFVLVPNNQPAVPIRFTDYPSESDPSPYPIPSNLPIEGWPSQTGSQTLTQVQRNTGDDGDRHAIIIQPGTGYIWETWRVFLTSNPTNWQAANGARFNLTNNALRPAGWTSADAGGLSMLAGLVRFDECERGEIEHALRMIVKHTRREYIYPATHHASSPSTTNPDVPAMGQRLRLKSNFVVPANWTKQEKAIAAALKKYGGIIADNSSSFFSISVVPDQRWPSGAFSHIMGLSVTNFEVIQTTGPTEGPRSPGAPVVNAGPDRVAQRGVPINLSGTVQSSNPASLAVQWKVYSGPGAATFGNAGQTNTTATFQMPGQYVLTLSADNGIHTPGYDATLITVQDAIQLSIERAGTNITVRWTGGNPPFEVESATSFPPTQWTSRGTYSTNFATFPMTGSVMFFRVRGQ